MGIRTIALTGAAVAGYAALENRAYRVAERRLEVAASAPPVSVLHISDLHLSGRDHSLIEWLGTLPGRLGDAPDIVVSTGDLIDDDSGIDPLTEALAGIRGRLGNFFVFGSHDYFQSTPRGALLSLTHRYSGSREPRALKHADSELLMSRMQESGWTHVINDSVHVFDGDKRILIAGIDDPFLNRHTTEHIERSPADDLAIGLVHAPDIVSEWVLAGFDLILAGHTHGGQIRMPIVGALVTNCTLPSALAGGAHRVGAGWLHVSPGLGTSKFAPVRFLCRPEVTLLRLIPG
jgi:uncharacterized protein